MESVNQLSAVGSTYQTRVTTPQWVSNYENSANNREFSDFPVISSETPFSETNCALFSIHRMEFPVILKTITGNYPPSKTAKPPQRGAAFEHQYILYDYDYLMAAAD
jgi:hypothetical protein